MPHCSSRAELDRREFMRLALMSSMALIGSSSLMVGEEVATKAVPGYGAMRELPPGAVRPTGWLRVWLEKQASQLGYNLPKVSWPFSAPIGKEKIRAESWWPWEQKAYWLDGANRLALVLNDERLNREVQASFDYTLAHISSDGYIGPAEFENPIGDFHRWPHTILFRGLAATADANRIWASRKRCRSTTFPTMRLMECPSATSPTLRQSSGATSGQVTRGCSRWQKIRAREIQSMRAMINAVI